MIFAERNILHYYSVFLLREFQTFQYHSFLDQHQKLVMYPHQICFIVSILNLVVLLPLLASDFYSKFRQKEEVLL